MKIITDELELNKPCVPVKLSEVFGVVSMIPSIARLMIDNDGVGLAANQVGIHKTFFISEIKGRIKLFINPKITYYSEEVNVDREGCLSYIGIFKYIQRSSEITVQYFDYSTKKLVKEIYLGFEARIIQHEVDHLNSVCKVGIKE